MLSSLQNPPYPSGLSSSYTRRRCFPQPCWPTWIPLSTLHSLCHLHISCFFSRDPKPQKTSLGRSLPPLPHLQVIPIVPSMGLRVQEVLRVLLLSPRGWKLRTPRRRCGEQLGEGKLEKDFKFRQCFTKRYLRARFGGTYTKIGTIQRLASPLRKDDTQLRKASHVLKK